MWIIISAIKSNLLKSYASTLDFNCCYKATLCMKKMDFNAQLISVVVVEPPQEEADPERSSVQGHCPGSQTHQSHHSIHNQHQSDHATQNYPICEKKRGSLKSRSSNSKSSRSPSPSRVTFSDGKVTDPTMSPSKNFAQSSNTDNPSYPTGIKIESSNHVVFSGMSRLNPPLLAGRQTCSAPPSPTAGSKQNHTPPGSTLTNIDSKLRRWISSKYGRVRKRVIFKNGDVNLHQTHISKRRRRYLKDIFITLVDIQWRFTLLIFTLSFLLSWLLFAVVWWGIGQLHGDLLAENIQKMKMDPPQFTPCIQNFHGFTSAFLFSIETQHTIGYGFRFITEECPFGVLMVCFQSVVGVFIQAVMVGVIFAKLSRPKKRTETIVFSRNAVVCQRDGQLCLIFRVGDMRKSRIISATVRAQIIRQKVTREGEVLPYYQHELNVGVDAEQSSIFFIWPVMVVHKIDADSPLYGMSADDLRHEQFEIVVILEGVIETTGATTQARSSYLPTEVLWGHRFEPMVSFRKELGEYTVDHTVFNSTYETDTPTCSAKELDELNRIQAEMRKQASNPLLAQFHRPSIAHFVYP